MKPEHMDVGTVFYECGYGVNLELTVKTKPVLENDQWKWVATNIHGIDVNYLITKGLETYGPKIYDSPQYESNY